MTPRSWNPLLPGLAAVGLLASCGGGGDAPSSPPEATAEVLIERSRYLPDVLEVAGGATVTWTNLDRAVHTVTSAPGSAVEFASGDLGLDDTFTQVFTQPGSYDYFCEVHPTMRSTVVVD